jgi:PAS domain S-box-containing protein
MGGDERLYVRAAQSWKYRFAMYKEWKSSPFISAMKFFKRAIEWIKASEFLNKIIEFRNKKHFSTYLVTTFAAFATLSVVFVVIALFGYFDKRVESEFRKKILAQKGQVEIILNNRIAGINSLLKDLGSDNIIKVTVMLDGKSQLKERVSEFYPSRADVHFFVKKQGESAVIPESYPEVSKSLIELALKRYPYGEILEEGANTRLLWWLSTPIMDQTHLMGTAYALYDMTRDKKLIEQVHQTVNGDVLMLKSDQLYSLASEKALQLDEDLLKNIAMNLELFPLGNKNILSKIAGFDNLYFKSSLEALANEKRKVTLWIGLSSIVILALSIILSIRLGKRMVEPLGRMTKMARQISEGQKNLSFETGKNSYWEFEQLSQAFNYMLANLKLAEEQSRYQELFENVDDAVYILDRDGKVLEANEAAYTRLGYTPEQFFELNIIDIIPQKQAGSIIEQLSKENQEGDSEKITLETTHSGNKGELIPVEIQSRAISYRGRSVILNVARDVTARIEAEKEKNSWKVN